MSDLLGIDLGGRTCRARAECLLDLLASSFFHRFMFDLLLFFGGLLGIPIAPNPPISPGPPPYGLCDPAAGIGKAPFLSGGIMEPF